MRGYWFRGQPGPCVDLDKDAFDLLRAVASWIVGVCDKKLMGSAALHQSLLRFFKKSVPPGKPKNFCQLRELRRGRWALARSGHPRQGAKVFGAAFFKKRLLAFAEKSDAHRAGLEMPRFVPYCGEP